jgi:hypothetical protein
MSAFTLGALTATALVSIPVAAQVSAAPAGAAQDPVEQQALEANYNARVQQLQRDFEARLAEIERRLAEDEKEMRERDAQFDSRIADKTASDQKFLQSLSGKWYERLSVRGYTQFRTTTLFGRDLDPNLVAPADSSVSESETFLIRRGRFVLSGDVTDHLYLYAQPDVMGSVGGTGDKGLQSRDLYADISIDADKEYRFRLGQSKVPFGFVNMQSSQNRAALERPDALNSAVEGERDLGVFFYWAPKEIRDRFRHLVRSGLKGSGDYGVLGVGVYSGQGLNRADLNGDAHVIARASYPFELAGGQIVELGVQAYTGEFVVGTQAIGGVTPTADPDGVDDERAGVTAVLYPQPFGIEAEWVWGRGPELSRDLSSIDDHSLQGGYVQLSYALGSSRGALFPFVRWNYFDGARKFARNAPWSDVSELDLGFEWSPWPEVELAIVYTHTFHRTNTVTAPFDDVNDAHRIGFQLQWNY